MKKKILLSVSLLLVFTMIMALFAGCGEKGTEQTGEIGKDSEEPTENEGGDNEDEPGTEEEQLPDDGDDSISVIDTEVDEVVNTISARSGFEKLNIKGYIQGISIGTMDDVFVYGCAGNGALVKFWDVCGIGKWMISYPGGKISSQD